MKRPGEMVQTSRGGLATSHCKVNILVELSVVQLWRDFLAASTL